MKRIINVLLLSTLVFLISGCSSTKNESNSTKNDPNKITIYTTVYPLSYFAEQIGGDFVNVSSIYPPGSNEHTFEPTQQDMMALADADLFFYIGLGLEGFVEKTKDTLKNENVKLVATSENISEQYLHAQEEHEEEAEHDHDHSDHSDHDHGDIDPHVWLSPEIAKELALSIKEQLVATLPDEEKFFNANYEQLMTKLDTLNQQFEKMVSEISNKTFFVSHASFGYIAEQYGLEQVAIAGINSQSEPSQKELAELVKLAEELKIDYILFEQNVSSNLSTVIQKEIGAKPLELHNLSVLTKEDIQNEETYFTLMEKNIETLKQALSR